MDPKQILQSFARQACVIHALSSLDEAYDLPTMRKNIERILERDNDLDWGNYATVEAWDALSTIYNFFCKTREEPVPSQELIYLLKQIKILSSNDKLMNAISEIIMSRKNLNHIVYLDNYQVIVKTAK